MAHLKKSDILIANPEPVLRAGLAHLIDAHPQLRVCAEAETAGQVRQLCARHRPRVLILDPFMGDGFALIKDVRQRNPATHIVVLSASGDAAPVQRAFRAGACGFITRRDPVAALLSAIVGALAGERHIGPAVELLLLDHLACGGVEMSGDSAARLSNRELQVFQLIGRGLTTRAVAAELGISVKTVETHRQRIKEKLDLRSGVELQHRALQHNGGDGKR